MDLPTNDMIRYHRSAVLPFVFPVASLFVLLLASIALTPTSAVAASPVRGKALLIGVSRYDAAPRLADLPLAFNDAWEVAKTLKERNDYKEVRLLCGESDNRVVPNGDQPTKQNIEQLLGDWLENGNEEIDTLFVFFSGHGVAVPEKRQTYLAPKDFDPDRPEETGISVSKLQERLGRCDIPNRFLILDTCHAGAPIKPADVGRDFTDGTSGVITLASAKYGQRSRFWEDRGMSTFSFCLNEGLRRNADADADGLITADELYAYVFNRVRKLNILLRTETEQTPVRVVGPEIEGVPPVASVRPTTLEALLEEIADGLAGTISLHRLRTVGMLEFTFNAQREHLLGHDDYELLSLYCRKRVEEHIRKKLKGRKFTILSPEELLADTTPREERKSLPHLAGNLAGRTNIRFRLECKVLAAADGREIDSSGGEAILSMNDWAMLRSVNMWPIAHDPVPENGDVLENMKTRSHHKTYFDPGIPTPAIPRDFHRMVSDNRLDADEIIPILDWLSVKQRHPMLQSDCPFDLEIWVADPATGQFLRHRRPVFVGDRLYVPLEPDEVYQIRIRADLDGDDGRENRGKTSTSPSRLALRLLVDGLNTLPEKREWDEREPSEPLYDVAKRISLERASAWSLEEKQELIIDGFYTEPGQNALYYPFIVRKAADAESVRNAVDGRQVGLITAAFYTTKTVPPRTRGQSTGRIGTGLLSDVGTGLGCLQAGNLTVRPENEVDAFLAVLHLRYASARQIERLQTETGEKR